MQYGERLEDLADALQGHPVSAILLMCSRPNAVSAGLPRLRQGFDGPIGGYANIGYDMNPDFGTVPGEQRFKLDQSMYPPEQYAEFARTWLTMGAQIIGGCCATGPAHIEALRPVVKVQPR
jgi:homocysteine S-methyltransferase